MHGMGVLHGLVVPLQHGRRGLVLGGGVPLGGLLPERQGVDCVGRVERLKRNLPKTRKQQKKRQETGEKVSKLYLVRRNGVYALLIGAAKKK